MDDAISVMLSRLSTPVRPVVRRAHTIADCSAFIPSADSVWIIADSHTQQAAGAAIANHFGDRARLHILPSPVTPQITIADDLARMASGCKLLCAVGSGTIGDLVKLASARSGIPYIMIATAPSMNGYLSATSSVIVDGYPTSVPATLPQELWIIDEILTNAPMRMIRAGVADLLASIPAKRDWQLAHHLTGSPFSGEPYDMLTPIEQWLLTHPEAIRARAPETMQRLMEGLCIGGLQMTLAGSSAPASQSEHMLAHAMHLFYPHTIGQHLHGEEIAVTTLLALDAWQHIRHTQHLPDFPDYDARWPSRELYISAKNAYAEKQEALRHIPHFTHSESADQLRELRNQLCHFYQTIGLATEPAQLGWSEEKMQAVLSLARFTRNRITCLDFI